MSAPALAFGQPAVDVRRRLRFFSVYGRCGRQDLMPYHFTRCILRGEPIAAWDAASPQRDRTYIDDAVETVSAALDADLGCEVFDLGHGQPVSLSDFICCIERLTHQQAPVQDAPLPLIRRSSLATLRLTSSFVTLQSLATRK